MPNIYRYVNRNQRWKTACPMSKCLPLPAFQQILKEIRMFHFAKRLLFLKEYEAQQRSTARAQEKAEKEKTAKTAQTEAPAKKRKLSFKEKKELEQIEKDLEELAAEKAGLEESISSGSLPYEKLQEASERIGQIIEETDIKEMRWLELQEIE